MFSSGISSWAAARRHVEENGLGGFVLLFADTFIECDDNYRFLIEAAAQIAGVSVPNCAYESIPSLTNIRKRKEHLQRIACEVQERIPILRWIWDGRTPWEVMQAVRMIGNTRVDPCSKLLKRDLLRKWLETNCAPDSCSVLIGLSWEEMERLERVQERALPWVYRGPLAEKPWLSKKATLAWAESEGLRPPAMYDQGFAHANCGGFCIKAGQGSFKLLLEQHPERYSYHEAQELKLREILGDHAILRDRRGGVTKPMSLEVFRKRLSKDGDDCEKFELGGCGCGVDI